MYVTISFNSWFILKVLFAILYWKLKLLTKITSKRLQNVCYQMVNSWIFCCAWYGCLHEWKKFFTLMAAHFQLKLQICGLKILNIICWILCISLVNDLNEDRLFILNFFYNRVHLNMSAKEKKKTCSSISKVSNNREKFLSC